MAAGRGARIPVSSWAPPLVGLVAWLLFGKSAAALAGAGFAVLLVASVLAAVHHAEIIAHRIGEPFGTLTLSLAVTVIEVALIVSLMLSGDPNPALARDSVHATVVIVLHGLAGLCIVVGTMRHGVQEYRIEGAHAFLTVLLPMVAVALVLPSVTISAPGPYYSPLQLMFASLACLALYAVFVFIQTVRHREYFLPRGGGTDHHAAPPDGRTAAIAAGLLLVSLVAVVLLAKALAPFIQNGVAAIGAPVKLVGVIVAAIVLLPESVTALRAARRDQLQTSINLALGSAVACIGLTIPAVAAVAWYIGQPLELGLDTGGMVLLGVSFMLAMLTYGLGRTTILSGVVHLIMFGAFLLLIFAP